MRKHPFDPKLVTELPAQLPVFPLPGATLLPGTQLPLNIFEPRYLNMVLDALGGERMIGMVQPQEPQSDPNTPALYDIGCAGRIVSFAETGDGRLLITLRGVCRYRLGEELRLERGYRRVVPAWTEFATDLQPGRTLDRAIGDLRSALQDYLRDKDVRVDWDGLQQQPVARIIDILAINLPFTPHEKQALLEADEGDARWQVLLAITQMVSSSHQHEPGTTRH
jgi:Lon protease-like protein